MIRVKITTSFPDWPILRQTPGQSGVYGDCAFFTSRDVNECDFWVVLDDLCESQTARCPPQNTILITCEPPDLRSDSAKFLRQFHTVITCERRDLQHPHLLFAQQGLPWHVGRKIIGGKTVGFSLDYDSLKAMEPPPKKRLVSVICSNKTWVEGHRRRIQFVKRLKEYLGDRLDVFGSGVREIPDKWDAIYDYKYHIALENSVARHYWTEKLSDPFLGWSFPFYYGCPNVDEYFSVDSYRPVDLDDPQGAAAVLAAAIDGDLYERSLEALAASRALVLDKYNVFRVIADLCGQLLNATSTPPQRVVLRPSRSFKPLLARLYQRLRPTPPDGASR